MEFLNYFSNVFTFTSIVILVLGTIGGLLMGTAVLATKCEHYGEKIETDKVYFFQNCLKDHQKKYKDLKFRKKLNEKALKSGKKNII